MKKMNSKLFKKGNKYELKDTRAIKGGATCVETATWSTDTSTGETQTELGIKADPSGGSDDCCEIKDNGKDRFISVISDGGVIASSVVTF